MPHPGTILAKQKFRSKKNPYSSQVAKAARDLGSMGGNARAAALTNKQTHNIAIHAACARWGVPCHCSSCR